MQKLLERLEDGLFQKSRDMRPPWGPVLRLLRYPVAIVRDWWAGDIAIRAMSLAYTTLLSIVPLLVLSFSILKGLGARTDLRFVLHEFFRPLGNAETELTESVLQFVKNMRSDVLGSIGLAFLIYTVVSTIQKVEESFNIVWQVAHPRTYARRFTEYLSVIIVGPILLAVALGLLATAKESPAARWLDSIPHLAWILSALGQLVSYAIVTAVFTFMYLFVPNTRVKFQAALIGGVTAGIIWALVGTGFTAFIVYSSQMVAIYTGFAVVLTTLVWVYVSWLILLVGAQLAFYVQSPQYLRHGRAPVELAGDAREQISLSVMYLIGRDYRAGEHPWSADRLAAELDIPETSLAPVLESLEKAGLVVATDREQFLPGRDLEGIALAAIIEASRVQRSGRSMTAGRPVAPAAKVMAEVDAAMRRELGDRSLKDLIAGV